MGSVMIETSLGEFVVDLYVDRCPLAAKNFLKLCKVKYYNNVLVYNVQQNFMIQAGDPTGACGASSYVAMMWMCACIATCMSIIETSRPRHCHTHTRRDGPRGHVHLRHALRGTGKATHLV